MTDGSILVSGWAGDQTTSANLTWYRYAPDATGNYANGTWSKLASAPWGAQYYPSFILNDGRFWMAGGEYVSTQWANPPDSLAHDHVLEYDPVADTWTSGPDGMYGNIGDTAACMLNDGRMMVVDYLDSSFEIFDATTNSWTGMGAKPGLRGDEMGMQLLPDGSVFECYENPGYRYLPSTNQWIPTATCPINMFSSAEEDEQGPMVYLQTGNVMCIADNGGIALYTPPTTPTGAGSWTLAPSIPGGLNGADVPAALESNGKVLM